MSEKISVALVGASGYTGSELARLLAGHDGADLTIATATGERAGQKLSDLFPHLRGVCDLVLQEPNLDEIAEKCQVAVVALGHGKALEIAPQLLSRGVRVIDLGADYRLRDAEIYREWYGLQHSAPKLLDKAVYGLPEWNRDKIRDAQLVANPGCYPTSAILALAPFVAQSAIKAHSIIVNSASGVSGAGRASFGVGTHFPEYVGDFKAYNVGAHRHTPEIEQMLADVAPRLRRPAGAPDFDFYRALAAGGARHSKHLLRRADVRNVHRRSAPDFKRALRRRAVRARVAVGRVSANQAR